MTERSGLELRWEPERFERTLTRPTTLLLCSGASSCTEITTFEAGARIHGAHLSLLGSRVFVGTEREGEPPGFGAYDAQTGERRGLCEVNPARSTHVFRSSRQAVAGEGLLYQWSAGSDDTVAKVCGPDGEDVATIEGPILQLSATRRHAARVPGRGTPRGWARQIPIHDLTTGEVIEAFELDDAAFVEAIEWRAADVVFSIRHPDQDGEEAVEARVVPLP